MKRHSPDQFSGGRSANHPCSNSHTLRRWRGSFQPSGPAGPACFVIGGQALAMNHERMLGWSWRSPGSQRVWQKTIDCLYPAPRKQVAWPRHTVETGQAQSLPISVYESGQNSLQPLTRSRLRLYAQPREVNVSLVPHAHQVPCQAGHQRS